MRVLARHDRFDRFVSVLVYVPRERYDSHIRVKIGEYLARAFIGRVSAFYPFFPEGPLVRVHFIIGRSGGAAPRRRSRRAGARGRGASCALGPTGCARRWRCVHPPDEARELFARYRRRVFRRLPRSLCAGDRGGRHPHASKASRRAPARRRFPSPAGGRPARRRPQSLELGAAAAAVGARAGAGKHGLPRGRRAHLPHRQPTARDGVWFHDMLLEARDGGAIDLDSARRDWKPPSWR